MDFNFLVRNFQKPFGVDRIVNQNYPCIHLNTHTQFHKNRSIRLGGVFNYKHQWINLCLTSLKLVISEIWPIKK